MKLHAIRASHNCRRVLATASQLGIELEVVEPSLPSGDLRKPEYLALNPMGKVPTLELDGGGSLWESNAIMHYLASLKPGNALWPEDGLKRAEIARWQFWDANHLSTGTAPLAFQRLFKPMFLKQQPDEAVVEKAIKAFDTYAPVLNGQLEGKRYIIGDDLTLADFSVGASFTYAGPAGAPLDSYPHIKAWLGRLDELPAWKASAPQM